MRDLLSARGTMKDNHISRGSTQKMSNLWGKKKMRKDRLFEIQVKPL